MKPQVADGNKRSRVRDKVSRAIPVPEANAELQPNLDVCQYTLSLSLSLPKPPLLKLIEILKQERV